MGTERFHTLDEPVGYRSKKIKVAVKTLWTMFYRRLGAGTDAADRAIWITNDFPAWFGVKPGSPDDDELDEPLFCISVIVSDLDSIRDELRGRNLPESEYRTLISPYYEDYRHWVNSAIVAAWNSQPIQRLHRRANLPGGRFGVYSTPIDDLSSAEIDQMTWLTGDRL